VIHRLRPQFVRPDRKIRETFPEMSPSAIKKHLALAMRGVVVGNSPGMRDLPYCKRDRAQYLARVVGCPAARYL
jgi:hypothetical protein